MLMFFSKHNGPQKTGFLWQTSGVKVPYSSLPAIHQNMLPYCQVTK